MFGFLTERNRFPLLIRCMRCLFMFSGYIFYRCHRRETKITLDKIRSVWDEISPSSVFCVCHKHKHRLMENSHNKNSTHRSIRSRCASAS